MTTWFATALGGIALGLIAAYFRLLDSAVAVVMLAALVIGLIGYGLLLSRHLWRDDED